MRLERVLSKGVDHSAASSTSLDGTQSSHGTSFDKTRPRRSLLNKASFWEGEDSLGVSSFHHDNDHNNDKDNDNDNDNDNNELHRLRQENTKLRNRIQQLEAELEQQHKDFEAQRHLNPFGGLSQLRASRVTIWKQLGSGSFGVVYQGIWRGVKCAIKFINDQVVDELRKESSIMDKIDHPNIVRMYGVAVNDDDDDDFFVPESWPSGLQPPCLIMEYMGYRDHNGQCSDFIQYLKNSKKDRYNAEHWNKLCAMLQGVARGLAYLHSQGVMHRDLKGVNLLISEKGILKISDFGLAKLYNDRRRFEKINGFHNNNNNNNNNNTTTTQQQSGRRRRLPPTTHHLKSAGHTSGAGTYTHMAPEVMAGGAYDKSADIFSFGIITSEAVAHAEAEEIVDETRTSDFGIAPDKLLQTAFAFKEARDIVEELVMLAVQCCDMNPKRRPTASHIVSKLLSIQLQHSANQLRARTVDASKQLFALADLDGNGKLTYHEVSRLTSQMDNFVLDEEGYQTLCRLVGAESSQGLTVNHLTKMYTELGLGDPTADLAHLFKSSDSKMEFKDKTFWYRG